MANAWKIPAGTILLAGFLAYANSFSGPFIFDDITSIPQNFSIRHLWSWWDVFSSARANGKTIGDRPLLNFSFALDYALHGARPWGYHVTNLCIHLLAALTLYGVLRRTFGAPPLREKFGADAELLAWATAMLWVVHPLTTEAVTYIVQRAESLASLFYLLVLYGFCRARSAKFSGRWLVFSAACCWLGVGMKEILASAPLVLLLYDRIFVAGSFRAAWRERKAYYLGLAGSWLVLGAEIASGGSRDQTVGVITDMSWGDYVLIQFTAIVHYLVLSVCPYSLVLVYDFQPLKNPLSVLPAALVVFALLGATLYALRQVPAPGRTWPALGFLGATFFLILAPSSSVIPLKGVIFEHRMYLALAVVLTLVAVGVWHLGRRALWIWVLIAGPLLAVVTMLRNADYRSALAIWSDTVAKQPDNYETRNALGLALSDTGRYSEALAQYHEVLRLNPTDSLVHCNLGVLYDRMGRWDDALEEYRQALIREPDLVEAFYDRGVTLAQMGKLDEAEEQFHHALRLVPEYVRADIELGVIAVGKGDLAAAVDDDQAALKIDADNAEAHSNLGEAYGEEGRFQEALVQYAEVLRIDPQNPEAHYNRGVAYTQLGQIPAAVEENRKALQLNPRYARAWNNLRRLQQSR